MDRDDAILDYLQQRLSPEDHARFEQAMREDKSLAAEVEMMRSVRAALATEPEHTRADAVWTRLSTSIASAPRPANFNRPPWRQALRYAAVALIAVGLWQVAVVPRISAVPQGFAPASEQSAAVILQIKFTEQATIGEITALLTPLEGTIVDGPGALGLLRVAFPDADARQDAISALNARADLVEAALPQ